MHLLLVEDEPMNVELFCTVLEAAGHDVVVETSGPGGYERGLSDRFDLILLDMQLPGMSGDAICRALRQAGVESPIVALSGSALSDQIESGLQAGFDAYLTKPISPESLRVAVLEWGQDSTARDAQAAR